MADEMKHETKRDKLEAAIEALRAMLDGRLALNGGYPAEIIGPHRGLLFVADVDDEDAPTGTVLDVTSLVAAYDVAHQQAADEAGKDSGGDPDDYFPYAFIDAYYTVGQELDDCEA